MRFLPFCKCLLHNSWRKLQTEHFKGDSTFSAPCSQRHNQCPMQCMMQHQTMSWSQADTRPFLAFSEMIKPSCWQILCKPTAERISWTCGRTKKNFKHLRSKECQKASTCGSSPYRQMVIFTSWAFFLSSARQIAFWLVYHGSNSSNKKKEIDLVFTQVWLGTTSTTPCYDATILFLHHVYSGKL